MTGRTAASAVLALCLSAAVAAAEIGVAFGEVPVGCRWRTEFSDRPAEKSTYAGPSRGGNLVEVTDTRGGALFSAFYTGDGHYAGRQFHDGRWEGFSPHSCFAVPGRCQSTHERGDGTSVRQGSQVRRQGAGYAVRAGEVGGAAHADETFRPGALQRHRELGQRELHLHRHRLRALHRGRVVTAPRNRLRRTRIPVFSALRSHDGSWTQGASKA